MDLTTYNQQHPEERYANIQKMSEILNRAENIFSKAESLLDEWQALQPDFDQLVNYYDSEQWREDYYDSNEGKIPENVFQGALSQDGIFDAIGDQFRLAEEYQEFLQLIREKESQS